MSKLGSYISNLMNAIRDTEEKGYLRQLALNELKNLNNDISGFIFQHIDEIETLPDFDSSRTAEVEKEYLRHWTCGYCGKHTHEVDYDHLSGTDHLGCVLEKEMKENNQLEINFGENNGKSK